MQWAQLVLEVIKVAVWPSALMLAIFAFRGSIPKLLERMKGAELPGTRLEFFEKGREIEQLTEAATGAVQISDDAVDSASDDSEAVGAELKSSQEKRPVRNFQIMERKREA